MVTTMVHPRRAFTKRPMKSLLPLEALVIIVFWRWRMSARHDLADGEERELGRAKVRGQPEG